MSHQLKVKQPSQKYYLFSSSTIFIIASYTLQLFNLVHVNV